MMNPARWVAIKIMERRRRKALLGLRRELAFWGINTENLTDDEIVEGCRRFGLIAGQMGVRGKDAAESFAKMARTKAK